MWYQNMYVDADFYFFLLKELFQESPYVDIGLQLKESVIAVGACSTTNKFLIGSIPLQ
jgi:hypothetical protein